MLREPDFGRVLDGYVAFRPAFPAALFEPILAVVPVERRQRAVDLGAGTGNSIFPLLPHFKDLIAVEPDLLMAQELRGRVPGIILFTGCIYRT